MWDALVSLSRTWVDFLFPRLCCSCGERILTPDMMVCSRCLKSIRPMQQPICPVCGGENAPAGKRCEQCPAGAIYFDAARAVTPYEGVARLIVERLKYSYREEYAPWMAAQMWRTAAANFGDVMFDLVIPVPLHWSRRRERGFNQSALLAYALVRESQHDLNQATSESTNVPKPLVPPQSITKVNTRALVRTRPTLSQTRLSKHERAENIRNAFRVRRPKDIAGKCILLVDDVYTTGATLNECARVLRENGAMGIYCLSYCRATLKHFSL